MKNPKKSNLDKKLVMEFENGLKMYAGKWYQSKTNPNLIFKVIKPKISKVDDFRLPQQVYIRQFLCTAVTHGLIVLREEIQTGTLSTFYPSQGKNYIEVSDTSIKNAPTNL